MYVYYRHVTDEKKIPSHSGTRKKMDLIMMSRLLYIDLRPGWAVKIGNAPV